MKCEECKVIGFSFEELMPDGLCNQCKLDKLKVEQILERIKDD